jgi:hypothetical protein
MPQLSKVFSFTDYFDIIIVAARVNAYWLILESAGAIFKFCAFCRSAVFKSGSYADSHTQRRYVAIPTHERYVTFIHIQRVWYIP